LACFRLRFAESILGSFGPGNWLKANHDAKNVEFGKGASGPRNQLPEIGTKAETRVRNGWYRAPDLKLRRTRAAVP
jgi:hypothetical protein